MVDPPAWWLVPLQGVLDLVGHLLDTLLGLAARLVDLAFPLQVVVAGETARGLLDPPFGVIGVLHVVTHSNPSGGLSRSRISYPDRRRSSVGIGLDDLVEGRALGGLAAGGTSRF